MLLRIFIICALLLLSSCASQTYRFGTGNNTSEYEISHKTNEQFLFGKPNKFLDSADWIWPGSLLAKLFLWNKNIDSHSISPETVAYMQAYLEKNDLGDVQVLVNSYRPGNQWKRLFTNKEIGGFWRYTLGILSTTFYTIMPGRFFGGDNYNPYTNTINLYSDDFSIALHEAAHAKDTNSRKNKGLYSAIYALPIVPLHHEAVATSDALSYLEHECKLAEEKEAYKSLHPAYGTYVGGLAAAKNPGANLAGAIPGHLTGAIAAALVNDKNLRCINKASQNIENNENASETLTTQE